MTAYLPVCISASAGISAHMEDQNFLFCIKHYLYLAGEDSGRVSDIQAVPGKFVSYGNRNGLWITVIRDHLSECVCMAGKAWMGEKISEWKIKNYFGSVMWQRCSMSVQELCDIMNRRDCWHRNIRILIPDIATMESGSLKCSIRFVSASIGSASFTDR